MTKHEQRALMVGVTTFITAVLWVALGEHLLYLPMDVQLIILLGYAMVWALMHLGFKKLERERLEREKPISIQGDPSEPHAEHPPGR